MIRSLVHLHRHQSSSSVNDELHAHSQEDNSLWYAPECYEIRLLPWSTERLIPVTVPTWMHASKSHLSEWKLFLSPCLCILRNRPLDYHFLFRLLTFCPSVKVFYMDPFGECYDRQQGLVMWPLHLVVILMYTDGFKLPITEG